MTGRRSGGEAGAALVESVVALALVGLLVGGGHELHRSVVRARLRTEATLTALREAASAAELARIGLAVPTGPGVTVTARTAGPVWTPDGCRGRGGPRQLRIEAQRDEVEADADAAPPVVLDVAAPAEDGAPTVAVRDPSGAPLPGVGLVHRDATGTERTLIADADGCVALPDTTGPALVTTAADATVGAVPIGDADVGTAEAPPITLVLGPTGLLRVEVTSEGEIPDVDPGGVLTWWSDLDVGGAAATATAPDLPRGVSALGEGRTVAAGDRTVIVGACGDPRAGGTAAAVDVPGGGTVELAVVLGAVRVDPPPDLAGRVVLERRRACPSGGGRPRLARSIDAAPGGAAQGDGTAVPVLVAVPDGTWEVRLEDDAGRLVAGPTVVAVAGPGTVAVVLS